MDKANMKNDSYIVNDVELSLDREMLEQYSKLVASEVGTKEFDRMLVWQTKVMLKTDSFEKAVYLYGSEVVSKKITSAIKEELDTFTIEYL